MSTAYPLIETRSQTSAPARPLLVSERLSWLERALLGVGIWEIPLQLDKYYFLRLEDSELGAVAGANVSITSFALLLLYPLWFLQAALSRKRTHQRLIWGLPMLAYMLFIVLSIFAAAVPILAVFDLLIVVQAYALFFYLANRVRRREDILFVGYVLASVLLTQSMIVFGLAALGERAHGQRYEYGPLAMVVWEDGRVTGTLISAVVAGAVMTFLWIPSVAMVLTVKNIRGWIFVTLTTGCGVLAVMLTQTRGAIVSMLFGVGIVGAALGMRSWLPKWTGAAVLVATLVGGYPLLGIVRNRVLGDDHGSADSRVHLSLIALEMIQDHPWFGYGAGNCHLAALNYANQSHYRAEWYYTIHSKYLLAWVETGLGGLLSFLCVMAAAFRYSLKAWNSSDRELAALAIAIAASMAGSMVHMSVDLFNSRAQVQLLWVFIGLAAALYRVTRLNGSLSPD